ncbi:conserved Plasmodium protein, unknown function [Plasmodium berghei]|uniref:Uncharacterized protein n=2 Tax=Plasmodium berghei TaxID=5821 RepID=A0A509AQZ2_PLABA|nr:conserved Plasmodium protein, unknown function [Plasmodium berghei ANKA]CXJ11228.1 conserved Plasmodium protein, unknown function [Plasmodium berghei]SCM26006.1 conserved Plasmodium protein, unknown function [Plasmodium berghei]SCN28230.1 conserved Plasmodium protein, unknown function [Plasmodium berghei]SCO62428.1 conserved Plasmodium protein, unknown function [Plasmodium berghei]SCO63986.1 conserved Plasmodium protein, unknown function [Plasmodium berghei]|eukprot:XP_034423882.1 conserved Plasmodium protein, unknown function [Plasmodium berghei ANKA]
MLTLISVCSYLFYTHKDSILSLVGLNSENGNADHQNEGNIQNKKKRKKKKKYDDEVRYFSDSYIRKKMYILRTYSDVDFHKKIYYKN